MTCQILKSRLVGQSVRFKKAQVFHGKEPLDNVLPEDFHWGWLWPEFFSVKFKHISAAMAPEACLALRGLHFCFVPSFTTWLRVGFG